MKDHPYVRYAEALIRVENGLAISDEIKPTHLYQELEKGLNCFKVFPSSSYHGKNTIRYQYIKELKGSTNDGYFLAPNIISKEQQARHVWNESQNILNKMQRDQLTKTEDVSMSIAPTAGEFLSFSGTTAGRGKPKLTLKEISLSAITSVTTSKPCFQYLIPKKGASDRENTCIIPDISIKQLMDFITIYLKMIKQKSSDDLMQGDVYRKVEGKGKSEKVSYQPKRPSIFRGNFPNPPRSSALGCVALLGAIGEFSKEADVSTLAQSVLDSLKEATMYMIKYGSASSFTYNHHVIDLAKRGKLRQLVDGIYFSQLYNQTWRTSKNVPEYQKFDLFSSRFLLLFTRPAFKDFLSFRAEYPLQAKTNTPTYIDVLFSTYFKKIEMIDPEIVSSAKRLGRWLNKVAYFAAKNETKKGSPNYWDELAKAKAKILIELESSTFSAKTGDALVAQAITRAGRISSMDAPEGAALFIEKTASGELGLDNAKNLLIAFSRLKNKVEQKELPKDKPLDEEKGDSNEGSEDLSHE